MMTFRVDSFAVTASTDQRLFKVIAQSNSHGAIQDFRTASSKQDAVTQFINKYMYFFNLETDNQAATFLISVEELETHQVSGAVVETSEAS